MVPVTGGTSRRYCDGHTRRDLLQVGALSALGLTLPDLLRLQAASAAPDVSCIFLYLLGGPSHMDMWDLKPDAPLEFRGEFQPISTTVPGIRISEHLPLSAKHAEKYAILRSVNHPNADHGRGTHYMQTGVLPAAGDFNGKVPNNIHPCFGSVVAREKGIRGSLPPYISMPDVMRSGSSAFLGAAYAPFVIQADPSSPQFAVRDVTPPPGFDPRRAGVRRELLTRLNRQDQGLGAANENLRALDTFYQKAHGLVTSPAATKAFDIGQERESVRDAYGRTQLGQGCLMARRLIEAGCRFVSINNGNWDTHAAGFHSLRNDLLPAFDRGFSTLLADLKERGMLDSTLVVVSGDFGRTPRINKDAGRDHWPNVFSVVMAGGGIRGGQVVGASDARGEYPKERPLSPEMVAATLFQSLGINFQREYHTPIGRPIQIVNNGQTISEVI
ncbi:MAG: DUF1501 domain-containing protein [Armatimonadetes bacterium]|nr:DUF1501 domain-containing protein [Armatimonadota bacterium]